MQSSEMEMLKIKWIWIKADYFVCVDENDYDLVKGHTFKLDKGFYAKCFFNGKYEYLHKIIMKRLITNDGLAIDHINRAKWDNRKSNLRVITYSENQLNMGYPYNAPYPSDEEKKEAINFRNNDLKIIIKSKQIFGGKIRSIPIINSRGQTFNSAEEAARILKLNASHIRSCCKGLRLTTGKLQWKYL
jgi:hypothetical protein